MVILSSDFSKEYLEKYIEANRINSALKLFLWKWGKTILG